MTNQEAKEILARYRVNTAEDADPEFAEALKMANEDRELGDWLREQQQFHQTTRAQFAAIEVPAGLKARLLAEIPRGKISRPFWGKYEIAALAAGLMEWRHIRHVPVENYRGELVGLISHRDLLKLFTREAARKNANDPLIVRDIMKTDLITITPETDTLEALYLMRSKGIGCLPVCKEGKLEGILTAHDFTLPV